jgi:MFS family permease
MSIGFFLAAMDTTLVMSSYATIGSNLHELWKSSWITTGYMVTVTSFQSVIMN